MLEYKTSFKVRLNAWKDNLLSNELHQVLAIYTSIRFQLFSKNESMSSQSMFISRDQSET